MFRTAWTLFRPLRCSAFLFLLLAVDSTSFFVLERSVVDAVDVEAAHMVVNLVRWICSSSRLCK